MIPRRISETKGARWRNSRRSGTGSQHCSFVRLEEDFERPLNHFTVVKAPNALCFKIPWYRTSMQCVEIGKKLTMDACRCKNRTSTENPLGEGESESVNRAVDWVSE